MGLRSHLVWGEDEAGRIVLGDLLGKRPSSVSRRRSSMVMRVASGMSRYGLVGLVLGIALSWVAGVRGPEASAQQTDRGGASGAQAGATRPAEGNRPQPPRPNTTGESNGTLA